jgi:hypothetical protein
MGEWLKLMTKEESVSKSKREKESLKERVELSISIDKEECMNKYLEDKIKDSIGASFSPSKVRSFSQYQAKFRKVAHAMGLTLYEANYDISGNCYICGENCRCVGYHVLHVAGYHAEESSCGNQRQRSNPCRKKKKSNSKIQE